jgi:hypothetical protein
LEPPEGGSAAEPRLGGFCQLVRAVSRFFALVSDRCDHYTCAVCDRVMKQDKDSAEDEPTGTEDRSVVAGKPRN